MNLWKYRNSVIAVFSALAIAASLVLRFGFSGGGPASNAVLVAVLIAGGTPLLLDLIGKLLKGEVGADLLAGISIVTAVFLQEYLAGAIVVLMLSGGAALENYAVKTASSVLQALAKRMPSVAHRREGAALAEIKVEDIAVGDVLTVFPHEICPVDGTVVDGHGTMDEAYLTGEPFLIDKAPGSSVISGAVNGDTALTIRAGKAAVDSRYARIVEVMKLSEENKPRLRRMGDRLAAFYTPLTLILAASAWAVSGDPVRFLSVLVVATPCPLLIGIPVAIIGAIASCAKRGVIVKNPSVFEQIQSCKTAIFDKTGTLTCGEPRLSEALPAPGFSSEEVLSLAASIERYSKHPLGKAVRESADEKGLAVHEAAEIREIAGEGLSGKAFGREILITNRSTVRKKYPSEHLPETEEGLECMVVIDGAYAATLRFRDTPREEGRSFIQHLGPRHHFNRMLIVSGDRESEVRYLAEQVGIDDLHGGKSPEEKLVIVRRETEKAKTLFVGDGINDAPAVMAATVGVPIGRHSDITSHAAGAVIMDSSLTKVDELMHISRRMRGIALQSAVGGMVLSFIAMIFASAGHLTPVAGAMVQEGIDLLAILNALRAAFPPKELSDF